MAHGMLLDWWCKVEHDDVDEYIHDIANRASTLVTFLYHHPKFCQEEDDYLVELMKDTLPLLQSTIDHAYHHHGKDYQCQVVSFWVAILQSIYCLPITINKSEHPCLFQLCKDISALPSPEAKFAFIAQHSPMFQACRTTKTFACHACLRYRELTMIDFCGNPFCQTCPVPQFPDASPYKLCQADSHTLLCGLKCAKACEYRFGNRNVLLLIWRNIVWKDGHRDRCKGAAKGGWKQQDRPDCMVSDLRLRSSDITLS